MRKQKLLHLDYPFLLFVQTVPKEIYLFFICRLIKNGRGIYQGVRRATHENYPQQQQQNPLQHQQQPRHVPHPPSNGKGSAGEAQWR